MPYSYHKEGDNYVVTKKDTGKVVGHTKGTKEALKKYLAALHINANEGKINTMKKSELRTMIGEIIKEVINEDMPMSIHSKSNGSKPAFKPGDKVWYLMHGGKKVPAIIDQYEIDGKHGKPVYDVTLEKTGEMHWGYEYQFSKRVNEAYDKFSTNSDDSIEKKKVQMLKPEDILTSGAKVLWAGQTAKTPSGKTRVDLEFPNGNQLTMYWGSNTIVGVKKNMEESVDYDTAIAYRLTVKGDRDIAMANVKALLDNLTIGKSKKFPEVKVVMLPSKGNPQDIILKLNGPGAFSMSKDIKARPELKGIKVSTYKPQLTKIS